MCGRPCSPPSHVDVFTSSLLGPPGPSAVAEHMMSSHPSMSFVMLFPPPGMFLQSRRACFPLRMELSAPCSGACCFPVVRTRCRPTAFARVHSDHQHRHHCCPRHGRGLGPDAAATAGCVLHTAHLSSVVPPRWSLWRSCSEQAGGRWGADPVRAPWAPRCLFTPVNLWGWASPGAGTRTR